MNAHFSACGSTIIACLFVIKITWWRFMGEHVDMEENRWHRPFRQDLRSDTSLDRNAPISSQYQKTVVVHKSTSNKSVLIASTVRSAFHL